MLKKPSANLESYVLDSFAIRLDAECAQRHKKIEVPPRAAILRLTQRMQKNLLRKIEIEIDQECSMHQQRPPPAGLGIAGDLPPSDRNIRGSLHYASDAESVKQSTDQVCTLTEASHQVEAIGRRRYQRIVQYSARLEHCAAACATLEHHYAKFRARV